MIEIGQKKGLILFGGLILILVILSAAAYLISGPKGIEERFSEAVGLSGEPEEEEGESGILGFNIEGNPVAYMAILSSLALVCLLLYRWYKI